MEDGIKEIFKFFDNWIILKHFGKEENPVNEYVNNIKLFYEFM